MFSAWLNEVRLRVATLFHRRRLERDLEDEMAFHLAMREEKLRQRGAGAKEAGYAAQREFGNRTRFQEVCREMWTFASLENFWQDVRYGARMLRKNPGFGFITVITLSLGIGSSTWLFNMVRQWVIEAVAFPQPSRLMVVWEKDNKRGWLGPTSAPGFLDWREGNTQFESLSAWSTAQFNVTGFELPQRLLGARVTVDFFRTLRVPPAVGRGFLPGEDQPGAAHVAIISDGLWRERFNAARDLSKAVLRLDGDSYAVIGVLPEHFHFTLMGRSNIWVPVVFTEPVRADRGRGWLQVVGRLAPGATRETAQQELAGIAARLEQAYPQTNRDSGVLVETLTHEIGKHVGDSAVYTMFVVATCILLIACSNIAGVYLAQALARQKEVAMRLALGAGRIRIARQLLSENTLLIPLAAGLGVLLAAWGGEWLPTAIPYENRGYLPNYGRVYTDGMTVVYAAGAGLLCALLFSLAPLLESRRLNLTSTLKDAGSAVSAGRASLRLRKSLVAFEVILALVTLVPAGLTVRSLVARFGDDPGFRAEGVQTAALHLPSSEYRDAASIRTFYGQVLERVRSLPQVERAGVSRAIPMGHSAPSTEFRIEGQPEPELGRVPFTRINAVTPEYLAAVGLHLVSGRFVAEQDGAEAPPVAVVNDTFVRRHLAGEDPVGHRVRLGSEREWRTIVGVVRNVKLSSLGDPPERQAYVPFAQSPARSAWIVVRTARDAASLTAELRSAVLAIDPQQPISQVKPLAQWVSEQEAPFMILGQFAAAFGVLALFLAALGLYGVVAFVVQSRTREIGIRLALGAAPGTILRIIAAASGRMMLIAVPLGLFGGWGVGRLMTGLLGVTPNDPLIFAGSVAVLCIAVLLATLLPARRAMRVDPLTALRYE